MDYLKEIEQKLPPLVTRKELSKITGNLITVKTLANLDCIGTGINQKIYVGKKCAYPKQAVIEFLKSKIRTTN